MSTTQPVRTTAHGRPRLPVGQGHRSAWVVPLIIGFVFGGWSLFVAQDSGADAGTAAIGGLVAWVVMAVVCFLIGRRQHRMQAESQAIAYGVVFGVAMGYLINLGGHGWLRSSLMGLAFGLAMGATTFYFSYARRH